MEKNCKNRMKGDSEKNNEEEKGKNVKENKILYRRKRRRDGRKLFGPESVNFSSKTACFNTDHLHPHEVLIHHGADCEVDESCATELQSWVLITSVQ
jgi:hypothetical protein